MGKSEVGTGLVIFDCDGVLVDSEAIANRVLWEHLQAAGIALSEPECLAQFRGHSAAQCQAMITQWLDRSAAQALWQTLQAETLQALAQVQPVAGVEQVLRWLQLEGFTFCVASAGDYQKMGVTLAGSGLRPAFDFRCFSAVDVPRSKPAPDVFLWAADQMHTSPHRCLVVEDSALGVQAALAAGMAVGWYQAGAQQPLSGQWQQAGVQVFTAMTQLPALINQWRETLK